MISICQFKAFFDLAHAAQVINVILNNIASLNKRLTWQIENKSRKLKYVKFDFDSLRLMIFINSVYFNNRNFIFQFDYVICLIDASNWINILRWFLIKCKRMIQNVLIFEIYELIYEFDFETILKTTIKKILRFNILLIVCIDFRFLYQCLMKLKTIEKKRLIIDVINLRQLYERRKITEIKWIDKNSNLINVWSKAKSFPFQKFWSIRIKSISQQLNKLTFKKRSKNFKHENWNRTFWT